ncbi:unnamed protein product [Peronospora belbahrii]|uniref:PH domain-containing protein n=1 Tax=Peronospora belbahrii TaxID=622444 RepID=A0AAU9L9I7_9STRA|nr:unnamed protein product [Peronospora belbahrii]
MPAAPDYCGWGAKQGSKVRSWKNRYFVLHGCELVYFSGVRSDGSGAGSGEKGRLQVVDVDYTPERKNGLWIHGKEKHLMMTTSSVEESRLLFRKIKQAIGEQETSFRLSGGQMTQKRSIKKQDGIQKIEMLDDTSLMTQKKDLRLVCEGWVEKLGQRSKIWKKRYMSLLANGMLEYRKGRTHGSGIGGNKVGKPQLHSAEKLSDLAFPSPTESRHSKRHQLSFDRHMYEDNKKSRSLSPSERSSTPSDADRFSNTQVSKVDNNRMKRGWLYKQGSDTSSWMLRYFVLSGNTLHHYKHVNGTSEALGNVTSVTRSNESTGSLGVQFDDGSTLNVYGETKADTEAWHTALCKASRNAADNTMKRECVLRKEDEEIHEDNGFHGWLLKKGQNFKTWKRRYFVLERSRLAYSASAGSEILGSGVVFEVEVGDLRPFCLDVRFQNGRLLHVVAPTQEAFLKWFDVLRKASNLVESFLAQSNGNAVIGEEFDNDIGECENVNDVDVEFTVENISEYETTLLDGEGASLWIAAMQNKPEYDALSSSTSSEDCNDNVAESEIVPRVIEASSMTPNDSQGCVGWLKKEGKNIKSWKLRYFTLYGSKLSYYKSKKGSLLRSVNVVNVAVHPSISRGLVISTVGGRKLIVHAESTEEFDKWLDSIRKAVSEENDRTLAVMATPTVNSIMDSNRSPENSKVSISHSGWLQKEGQRFKTWKRRFFTLKNSALIYYSEIGGVARGHGIVKGAHQDDTKPKTLVITFRSDKTMRVTAASEAEIKSWFRVFSQIDLLNSKMTRGCSDASDDVVDSEAEDGDGESTTRMSRFDPSDYLNDTISNDTILRLRDENGKATVLESDNDTVLNTSRTFIGELMFDEEEEEKEDMSLTINGEDYYRELLAEDVRIHNQRLAEKLATGELPVTGCTPCCNLM